MKTPEIDYSIKDLTVANLGIAKDVTNTVYVPNSTVVRIVAIEESRIKYDTDTVGVFLPLGTIEYFRVSPTTKITIEGKVNIMDCV